MITEDYVSFEIAKLLKEKGFDEDVDLWYDENGDMFFQYKYDIQYNWRVQQGLKIYQCPTLQMAMKWLREKNIIIVIQPEYFNAESKCSAWGCDIWAGDNYEKLQGDFPIYEEACETTIKYCLEHLI